MSPEVVVVRTGIANLASVLAALERVGASPRLTESPDEVVTAESLVLPGVGAFGPAMEHLAAHDLVEPLRRRLLEGRPTLCVCLGLQLLARTSEESPGVIGLDVFDGRVTRFPDAVRVPQLGWNAVIPGDHAYFAHSYRLEAAPEGWAAAWSEHGGRFVAALERDRVLACQFHPELSGAWGLSLMRGWLTGNPRSIASGLTPGCKRRIIPCLDCKDGRVVKGVQFSGLRDAGSPEDLAAVYEAQGADELVLLDVSATPEGRATQFETVRQVRRRLSIPLTVGGGVRSVEAAGRLLEAGADKVAVNTAAVREPQVIAEIARRFGSQCAVLALDAASRPGGGWEVVVLSGRERTGMDAVEWARLATQMGAGEILLTSWDRDGTRSGYDLELLAAVSNNVSVPVIASGGAADPEHLLAALEAGADAVLAASIFHDGDLTVAEVKSWLSAAGASVRL